MSAETTTDRAPYTVTAGDRMSNSAYHRAGKPVWWARVGGDFLDVPRVRGDEKLTFTIPSHLPAGTRVDFGVGPVDGGVRRFHTVRAS